MEFHSLTTLRQASRAPREMGELELTGRLTPTFSGKGELATDDDARKVYTRLKMEREWLANRAPYYCVYPVVVDCMKHTSLELPWKHLDLPHNPLLLRFASGHENGGYIRSTLAGFHTWANGTREIQAFSSILPGELDWEGVAMPLLGSGEETIESLMGAYVEDPRLVITLRMVLSICLLAKDPEMVSPEVLTRDLGRYQLSRDPHLVEKAIRRGKFGYRVGAGLEIVPHFRRPHFAIRWFGKGHADPRLRPIKGCIVHRQQAVTVPTGSLAGSLP